MKQLFQIEGRLREIEQIPKEETKLMKKRELNLLLKEHAFLTTCRLYLEKDPSETFIRSEIPRLKNRIDLIMAHWTLDELKFPSETVRKLKEQFMKTNDVGKLKSQLEALKFLIGIE